MHLKYQVRNSEGKKLTGTLIANDERDAINKLSDKALLVISLEKITTEESAVKTGKVKLPLPVLALFTRQLSTMLGAGLALVRCLDSLGEQSPDRRLKTVLHEVSHAVASGETLSGALRTFPSVFSTVYVTMVKSGENGGMLSEVLDRLADYLEMSLRLRQRIRSAMMYPLIVSTMGIGICIFMITVIIPVFVDIFKEFQHKLPLPTLILINVSTWTRAHLLSCLGVAVVTGLGLRYFRRTKAGIQLWDRLALRLPVFGPLASKVAFSRFARTLGSMLRSGVPILNALTMSGAAVNNVVLEAAVRRATEQIESGATMYEAMSRQKAFPHMLLQMVAAGEETGKVDEMLKRVAEHYDREIESMLSGLTSMLEPLLILFLGVVVGGVVIAMFLPIFRMTDAVQF